MKSLLRPLHYTLIVFIYHRPNKPLSTTSVSNILSRLIEIWLRKINKTPSLRFFFAYYTNGKQTTQPARSANKTKSTRVSSSIQNEHIEAPCSTPVYATTTTLDLYGLWPRTKVIAYIVRYHQRSPLSCHHTLTTSRLLRLSCINIMWMNDDYYDWSVIQLHWI